MSPKKTIFSRKASEKIKVTIVTPVFNQADTLTETIESVLAQSYKNIEYIIVNDGSTDNTQTIIEKYENKIKIMNQKNLGQSSALNNAWRVASGEYLTYLSADDILYKDGIKNLISHIDGTADIYYPDYDLIDRASNKIEEIRTKNYCRNDLVCKLICQPGLATIFKSEVFWRIGGWNDQLSFVPDLEFWLKASQFANFKRVPIVCGGFRIHGKSGSIRKVKRHQSDEILHLTHLKSKTNGDKCLKLQRINALAISSRSHLQSNRLFLGLVRYLMIFGLEPRQALKPAILRFILAGVARVFYYKLRSYVKC